MKSNSENSEVKNCVFKKCKEKYVKKLNKYRKYNISILIFVSICIVIDIIITWGLGKKPFFGSYVFSFLKGRNFPIIVFFILSLVYLFHTCMSKNEYFKDKNVIRLSLDIIFLFTCVYIILLNIKIILPILSITHADFWKDFLLSMLKIFVIVYLYNRILKNAIKEIIKKILDWLKNYFENEYMILKNKFIIIFIISYSLIFDIILFSYLKSINISTDKKLLNVKLYENIFFKNILYFIIGIYFLWSIRKIKNKYYDKGNCNRFISDSIYIINFFFIFYNIFLEYNIKWFLLYFKSNLGNIYGINTNFYLIGLICFICFYFLNSVWSNFIKISHFYLFALLILMTLTGWLSIKGFLVVNLVVTLINHFLSDIKYLYGSIYFKVNKNKKNSNFDYNLVDEKKTKEKISTTRFLVNIFIVILYVYLVLCEWFESILIEEKSYTTYEYIIFRISLGEIRIGFLLLLIMFIIFFVSFFKMFLSFLKNIRFLKKMSFFYKLDNYKRSIESFPINFIKKFVYLKKYVEIKKPNSEETNIKTSIHINSRKKSHRLYKYKNIEFHNKKPNSN